MRKILIALVLLFGFQASASHLISGNFTYEFVSQSGNQRTYKINLYLFRDVTGVNLPSTASVYYKKVNQSTVSSLSLTQASVTTPTNTCNSTISYAVHKYSANVTLDAASVYDFAYSICCRPMTATNLSNPSSQSIYLTTRIVSSRPAGRQYNNSVEFDNRIMAAPLNTPSSFVLNYPDADGDSLSYQITNVKGGSANTLTPSSVAYATGYSNAVPLGPNGSLTIDASTGTMVAQSSVQQTAVVSIKVTEWDKDTTGTFKFMGITEKEFVFNFHNNASSNLANASVDSASANFLSDTVYVSTSHPIYPNSANFDSVQVRLTDPMGTAAYVLSAQPTDNSFKNFILQSSALLTPGTWSLVFDYNVDSVAFMGACNRALVDSTTFTVDAPIILIAAPADSIYGNDTLTYALQHSGYVDSVQWMVTNGSVEMAYGIDSVQIAWGVSGNGTGELNAIAWTYGMSDTASISVTVYGIGITENELNVAAYPNPATDVLHVQGGANLNYEITDYVGRTLLAGSVDDDKISVNKLRPGQYVLRLTDGQRATTILFSVH
jgi:hypothetical protein